METTTTLNDTTLEGLQDLIKINIDSAKGFTSAADKIENEAIASLFRACGSERDRFASELRRFVHMNDEEAADSGTVKGSLHRWWLELRGTIQDGDEHAVLAEAERGEDAIKERYERVLKETAGSPLNTLLQDQYASVKGRHDQIRNLRDERA